MLNIQKFAEKKEDMPLWSPVTVMQLMNDVKLFIRDGEIAQYIEDNNLIIKESGFSDYVWDTRLRDNLFSLRDGKEQVRRRRAITQAVSGNYLDILRKGINRVLDEQKPKIGSDW